MFGFGKGRNAKPDLADILRLDERSFVGTVRRMVEAGPQAAWTMLAVAYQNLEPVIMATPELAAKYPNQGMPVDLDGIIRFISAGIGNASSEVGSRRLMWFFLAALVRRATEIASRTPGLQPEVADIWIMISRGCACLPEVLEFNQLWSEDEKTYFDVITTEKEGLKYGLHVLAPSYLRKTELLTKFAESHDIVLLPW
jgi:hypothetical protein